MLTEQEKIRICDENTKRVHEEEQRRAIENMAKFLVDVHGYSKEEALEKATQCLG